MGVLTFGGSRTQQQIRFLGFLSHKERYTRACSTSGTARSIGNVPLVKARLVFMANYPLERREDL
jgi:hypothetical protein